MTIEKGKELTDNETHTFGINRIPHYGCDVDGFGLTDSSTGAANYSSGSTVCYPQLCFYVNGSLPESARGRGQLMRRFVLFLEVWAVVALMLALPTPALAQTAPAETPSPTAYTDSVQGIEFSEGTVVDDTRFGASFAGQATGELPGYLVASTDYTPPSPGPDVTNNIVGGGWTLLGERGTIFGSFTGGAVRWNADGTLAEIVADMSVQGGSVDGTTIPSGGTGTFSGMLDHTPLSQGLPPTINGTLQVNL